MNRGEVRDFPVRKYVKHKKNLGRIEARSCLDYGTAKRFRQPKFWGLVGV